MTPTAESTTPRTIAQARLTITVPLNITNYTHAATINVIAVIIQFIAIVNFDANVKQLNRGRNYHAFGHCYTS